MSEVQRRWVLPSLLMLHLAACQGRPGADARNASKRVASDAPSAAARATAPSNSSNSPPPNASFSSPRAEAAATSSRPGDEQRPSNADTSDATPGTSLPELLDAAGNPLPQTEARPSAASPSLEYRLQLLVRAIAENNPDLALPSFFPMEAYKQVKAIAKPEQDWQRRLIAAFQRNVRQYHRQLGPQASGIRFARIEIPESKVKWMKPGSEGNRVGYFRVVRSKLIITTAEGGETPLEVTSMISWRGEWYVVHLDAFE